MATTPFGTNDPLNPGNINNTADYADMRKDLESIANQLSNIIDKNKLVALEARNIRRAFWDTNKAFMELNRVANSFNLGMSKTKDIQNAIKKNADQQRILGIAEAQALKDKNRSLANLYSKLLNSLYIQEEELKAMRTANIELDKRAGIFAAILKGVSKIPVLGDLLNVDQALIKMRELAKDGANSFTIFKEGWKQAFATLGDQISLEEIFRRLFIATIKVDTAVTEIAKNLIYTKDRAREVADQMFTLSANSNDAYVNFKNINQAFNELNETFGFAVRRPKELITEFIDLTKKIGLTKEATGKLMQLTITTGKSFHQGTIEALAQAQAVSSAYGVQLNNKVILEEIGKTSGQILANFQGQPGAIAKAIATANALGTSLSTVKEQAMALLDFESNIENELKAELLLGQTLNLERARAAALQGDYLTVMKELNNQNITWNKFSHMNVLQQNALAQSLGITSDQLSDQLMKQQFIGKSRQEILALGGEEVAQRMEQVSTQEKFNQSVEKLKDLVVGLVQGPFGQLLESLVTMLGYITTGVKLVMDFGSAIGSWFGFIGRALSGLSGLGKVMKGLVGMAIVYAAYTAAASAAKVPFIGPVLAIAAAAGILGAGFAVLNSKVSQVQDAYIDPQKDTVIHGPAGSFKTRPDDKILVGTNVGTPINNSIKPQSNADLTPLIAAMTSVRASIDKLHDKQGVVNMDGKKVGQGLVMGSYKLA